VNVRTFGLVAVLAGGVLALIVIAMCEQHRSTAQVACAAIKAEVEKRDDAGENLQRALEVCQENGAIRLQHD
jgi:hypothetical protein